MANVLLREARTRRYMSGELSSFVTGSVYAVIASIWSARTPEGHKRAADLLTLRKLFFTVEVQRLQHRSVADGEQVCLNACLVVNAGPGGSHEEIARTPFEAHAIDDRAAAALKDDVDGTARLAFGGRARARSEAVHLAGKGTDCRASRQRVHELQAHQRAAARLVQRLKRALGLPPAVAQQRRVGHGRASAQLAQPDPRKSLFG